MGELADLGANEREALRLRDLHQMPLHLERRRVRALHLATWTLATCTVSCGFSATTFAAEATDGAAASTAITLAVVTMRFMVCPFSSDPSCPESTRGRLDLSFARATLRVSRS